MNTSNRYNIIGYGVCGANERYLDETLKQFKELCDHVVIVCNKSDPATVDRIQSYGFDIRVDDREWGKYQNKIKEDLVASLAPLKPDWLVCLDMDETFDGMTREKFESYADKCNAMYFYIVNLWNEGWKKQWSFWNIRAWKWNGVTKFVNRPLHCGLAPEWAYHYGSYVPEILWHYGLKDSEKREQKVSRYKTFDPNAIYRDKSYYDALSDNTCEPIDADAIRNALKLEIPEIKMKTPTVVSHSYVIVSKDGREIDIPKSSLYDHQKRGFKLVKEL